MLQSFDIHKLKEEHKEFTIDIFEMLVNISFYAENFFGLKLSLFKDKPVID